MKTKTEILNAVARTDADRLLLAGLLDKEQTCTSRGYLTYTKFLDLNERAKCTDAVRLAGAGHHAVFWGGYSEAERGIYIFYPDYMDKQSAVASAPLVLLRAHKKKEDTLTHRDYLGAMMGLQIDRSMVGDILVHEQGADILVMEDIAEFLLMHFGQVGRKQISLTQEKLDSLHAAAVIEKEASGSVASPRLDSVVALVFGLGRREAQERIEKGLVFVNHVPVLKPDRQIEQGDRLTVRGMGRAVIETFGGVSRKGRLFLQYKKMG